MRTNTFLSVFFKTKNYVKQALEGYACSFINLKMDEKDVSGVKVRVTVKDVLSCPKFRRDIKY